MISGTLGGLDWQPVFVDFFGFGQADLKGLIFQLIVLHNLAVPPNLKISLVDIDDDVKIFIGPVFLQQQTPEYILQDTHHGHPVNILQFLKFGKCLY